jgi:pimeloyl-ACP methyl ester carboxylesterase
MLTDAKLSRRTLLAATLAAGVAPPVVVAEASLAKTGEVPLPQPRRRFAATAADGVRIAVQEWGDPKGPELLLIHGGMQSHLCWQRQLTGALTECRIITMDLRGHGESDKPSDPAAYAKPHQWAQDVDAVIKAASLRRPVIVAWSFGGVVLTNYLLNHGDAQLAGINFVGAITELSPALQSSNLTSTIEGLTDSSLLVRIDSMRAFVRACFERQPSATEFERILAYNALVSPAFLAGSSMMKMEGVDAVLRTLSQPVLVTQGEVDRAVPVEAARYIAERVPGAKLSLYAGVGHSPFHEASERFNRELLELIQRTR